jgi:hypothetical protein
MPGSGKGGKAMTREDLKEVLRVNFELYKDEPDFFDYITTLVIYMMEYEYAGEMGSGDTNTGIAKLQKYYTPTARYKVVNGACPLCNNEVPKDRNICPYCMAMVDH